MISIWIISISIIYILITMNRRKHSITGESRKALDEEYALFEQSLEDHKQGLDRIINDEMKAEVEEHITLLEEELKELGHELDELETNRYRFSPEGIAEFRTLSPFINLKHRHLVWNFVEEYGVEKILQAYFEGRETIGRYAPGSFQQGNAGVL